MQLCSNDSRLASVMMIGFCIDLFVLAFLFDCGAPRTRTVAVKPALQSIYSKTTKILLNLSFSDYQ